MSQGNISEETMMAKLADWIDNVRINLPAIYAGGDIKEIPHQRKPCLCIGGGPSLSLEQLDIVKDSGWKHTILCCDKVLKDVRDSELQIYATAIADGSEKIAKFFKDLDLECYAAFSVITHPSVVKAWGKEIQWYVPAIDAIQPSPYSLSFMLYLLTRKSIMSSIGNVGSTLWNLAFSLEADPIILIGYDFSEISTDPKDWSYPNEMHNSGYNPDTKNYYMTNSLWQFYVDKLKNYLQTTQRHTINCTSNGAINSATMQCKNFETAPLKETMAKWSR